MFQDCWRTSIKRQLDTFDEEYMGQATTATCPECETVVKLEVLVGGRGSGSGAELLIS